MSIMFVIFQIKKKTVKNCMKNRTVLYEFMANSCGERLCFIIRITYVRSDT